MLLADFTDPYFWWNANYSCPLLCYSWWKDHCGNLSSKLLLVIFLANVAPCSLISKPLSTTFFLPHIGCQAVLTMNQSFGGLFDCRWAEELTGMHSFHSLSIGPCAFNNSLTYHFFSWDWENPLRGDPFWAPTLLLFNKWAHLLKILLNHGAVFKTCYKTVPFPCLCNWMRQTSGQLLTILNNCWSCFQLWVSKSEIKLWT